MKYTDIILLLLLITFILLSIYYIVCVCEFKIYENFSESSYVGDSSCLSTTLENLIKPCDNCKNMTTTYDALKDNDQTMHNYHTDYTCANISGLSNTSVNNYNIDDGPYKYDIRNQHLLLSYKCVKLSPQELKVKVTAKGIFSVLSEEFIFEKIGTGLNTGLNTKNIRDQIENKIKGMLISTNIKNGPIYACISQAPYLNGQKARYDIVQHGKGCFDNGKACGDNKLLKYEILLIFPEGDTNKINKFISIIKDNTSRNALCFLNCGGIDEKDSLTLGCGCLNKDNSYNNADDSSYNSICLAPDSDYNDDNMTNVKANYSIIYFINPHNLKDVEIKGWLNPL
jgi:hypothetical protein